MDSASPVIITHNLSKTFTVPGEILSGALKAIFVRFSCPAI